MSANTLVSTQAKSVSRSFQLSVGWLKLEVIVHKFITVMIPTDAVHFPSLSVDVTGHD